MAISVQLPFRVNFPHIQLKGVIKNDSMEVQLLNHVSIVLSTLTLWMVEELVDLT